MRQVRIPFIGPLYESFVIALPLLSAIQFISILTILYDNVKENLLVWMPWITLPIFFGMVCAAMAVLMVGVFKFMVRSIWDFRQNQMGELVKKIDELQEQVARLGVTPDA